MSRKRGHSEMETAQPAQQTSSDQTEDLRQRLRNCVEFAALMQYIFLFGKVIKIDEDFGIDVGNHPFVIFFSSIKQTLGRLFMRQKANRKRCQSPAGPRGRMPETRTVGPAARHRPGDAEIRLVPSWPDP